MAISRAQKEMAVEKLQNAATSARTVVFVRFNTVTVEEANELRGVCETEGVGYMVAKKTLIRKVFENMNYGGEFVCFLNCYRIESHKHNGPRTCCGIL